MSFMMLSMTNLQGIVVSYFALYNLKNPVYISILMFISLGVQLLTALILPPIIKRFGKWKVNVCSLLGLFTTGFSLCASGTAFATQTFTGKLGEQQPVNRGLCPCFCRLYSECSADRTGSHMDICALCGGTV